MPDFKQFQLPNQANEGAREATERVVPFELTAPNINRTDKDLNIKNLHRVTDTETAMNHGQKVKVNIIANGIGSTIYTALNDYNIAINNVAASSPVVELPKSSLAGIGKVYVIKDITGSAASTTITVSPVDGETIDGDTSDGITGNFGVKRYVSDDSNWFTW